MNLKGYFPGYKVWSRAETDIARVVEIWTECLQKYGGPFLFGEHRTMADAMYAPVVTRFKTYDVRMSDKSVIEYCLRVLAMPEMKEWIDAAKAEPDQVDELEVEF
jgi:glutathione S-transferase